MNVNDMLSNVLSSVYENDEIFEAPSIYDEDNFQTYLNNRVNKYYHFLKQNSISQYLNELYKYREKIDSSKDELKLLNRIHGFIGVLDRGLNNYLNGKPHKFYESFSSSMNTLLNFNSNIITTVIDKKTDFYRIRKSDGQLESAKDLFHIPFELRHFCATQRYSIPGFPSMYLGSSSKICLNELEINNSDLASSYISRVELNESISVIEILTLEDFKNRIDLADNFNSKIDLLLKFIFLFPLYLSCTIKVKNIGSFKPEYIVPQFLLEFVSSRDEKDFKEENIKIHGIKFPSTKIKYDNEIAREYNLVLPIAESKNKGYCVLLKELLSLSKPVSLKDQLLKFYSITDLSIEDIDFIKLDEKIKTFKTESIE